ncbi:MAG: putative transporter [Candidatus Aminicenantales bacterium]|jgi:putative transport protein
MSWLLDIFLKDSVGQALLIICLVIVLGMILGSIKVFSVHLGVAGILFVGILFGHYGVKVNPVMAELARDLGLILFVYSIGQEVGPGFLASLRKRGLPLNLLAAGIVMSGGIITLVLHWAGKVPMAAAAGLLSGATTNTPSLAAIQQAIKLAPDYTDSVGRLPGAAYAMAYPFGVAGIILVMVAFRAVFRVDTKKEAAELEALKEKESPRLSTITLEVQNSGLEDLPISRIIEMVDGGVVVARLLRGREVQEVPRANTLIHLGDVILAVGVPEQLGRLKALIGAESSLNLIELPSEFTGRRVLVTRRAALGKSVQDLNLREVYGIVVTRIIRTGLEFSPRPGFRIQFGDVLMVVGKEDAIDRLAVDVGDSRERLEQPHIVPIFLGIALGVLLGSLPIRIPGTAVPVRIGLAGGPLIASIILSRIGSIGPLIWHMPLSANLMLRNVGISLFLACVGLRAGEGFVEILLRGGLYWILGAAVITVVPLVLFSLAGRFFLKLNFLSVCGLLAGSMTDPPALAFANAQEPSSDGVSMAFVAVYPLTMLLRVFTAQVLILFFSR